MGPKSQFTVTVVSVERGDPVWDAHVLVSRDLDDRMMWQGRTNQDGVASNLMPYIGDHQIRVQVIKAGYLPVEFRQIMDMSLVMNVTMHVDTTHHFASYATAVTFDTRAMVSR